MRPVKNKNKEIVRVGDRFEEYRPPCKSSYAGDLVVQKVSCGQVYYTYTKDYESGRTYFKKMKTFLYCVFLREEE